MAAESPGAGLVRRVSAQLGLPEATLATLPALYAVFLDHGYPAFGVAALAALAGSARATQKMAEYAEAVSSRLRHAELRQDIAEADLEDAGRVGARFEQDLANARAGLSPEQVACISMLFDDYMRTEDEDWLRYLRSAAANLASTKQGHQARPILAGLRGIGPSHVKALATLAQQRERIWRAMVGRRQGEPDDRQIALVAFGFAREFTRVASQNGKPRPGEPDRVLQVTPLGHGALRLLGLSPPDWGLPPVESRKA